MIYLMFIDAFISAIVLLISYLYFDGVTMLTMMISSGIFAFIVLPLDNKRLIKYCKKDCKYCLNWHCAKWHGVNVLTKLKRGVNNE